MGNLGVTAGTQRRAKALLIAGPTASGKSAVALALAERYGGTVINADSMQVYADLPILSAQPDAAERSRVPHALFGHRDAAEPSSVGRWLDEATFALRAAAAAGRLAVVVGGTGLHFKALVQGLSAIPAVPDAIRLAVRQAAEGVPVDELHRRLAAVDPASAARLRPTDPQRILRALEVMEATGRSLTAFQATREPPLLGPEDYAGLFLAPERRALNQRIDARFDLMMAAGALAEADALARRGLDPALPAMRALGLPPLLAHLAGDLGLDAAVAAAKTQTRAYAKRQMTFGRHQLSGFSVVSPEGALDAGLAALG
jgi:tRNA dimethylallyltransferase